MESTLADPLLEEKTRETSLGIQGDLEGAFKDKSHEIRNGERTAEESDGGVPETCAVSRGNSSFWQTTMNTVGLLFGMGMLAVSYAAQQGGWSSLSVLFLFAVMCCYTGHALGMCMKFDPRLKTYQDIAGAASGLKGRAVFTVFLYAEIWACLVGQTISVGDNLAQIFPGARLSLSWLHLESPQLLAIVAMLVILPTVCVRDLSYVSYLSLGGVLTSLTIVGAVAWTGTFGGVGFSHSIPFMRIGNWPLIAGIYAYCYSGHVVLPSIYSSMKDPSQYRQVLILSFAIATFIYGGLAIMGAIMFGESTLSQITLNIPTNLTVATIALWTTVLTPLSKFNISLTPIATELETLIPFPPDTKTHLAIGSIMRICLLFTILATALAFPFFGEMVAFIGSAIAIASGIILPCSFYLTLRGRSMGKFEFALNLVFILAGIVFAVIGTKYSVEALVHH